MTLSALPRSPGQQRGSAEDRLCARLLTGLAPVRVHSMKASMGFRQGWVFVRILNRLQTCPRARYRPPHLPREWGPVSITQYKRPGTYTQGANTVLYKELVRSGSLGGPPRWPCAPSLRDLRVVPAVSSLERRREKRSSAAKVASGRNGSRGSRMRPVPPSTAPPSHCTAAP